MDKIKKFFTWLFAGIGLLLLVIGGIRILNLGLKTYVFPKADYTCYDVVKSPLDAVDYKAQCEESKAAQKQSEAADSLSFVIVGLPVFYGFYRKTKSD